MAAEVEIERFFEYAGGVLSSFTEAIMRDGTIAAAGRQGIDELGMMLRAFPESIQVQEMGSIWNPTPGEIAASRDLASLTGFEVTKAEEKSAQLDHEQGQECGR